MRSAWSMHNHSRWTLLAWPTTDSASPERRAPSPAKIRHRDDPSACSDRLRTQKQPGTYNEDAVAIQQGGDLFTQGVVRAMTTTGRGRASGGRGSRGGRASGGRGSRGRGRGAQGGVLPDEVLPGDTWIDPSVGTDQQQELVQQEQETMAALYPTLWFEFDGAPVGGHLGLSLSQIPEELTVALQPHIDFLDKGEVDYLWTQQKMFKGVTAQSGKSKKSKFMGWQVQSSNPAIKSTVRLGLVDESVLGAIMIALADIDRLFTEEQYRLYYMVAHGSEAVSAGLRKWGSHPRDQSSQSAVERQAGLVSAR